MYQWIKEKISLILLKYHKVKYTIMVGGLFVICFVVPWLYGCTKLCLLFFKGV